MNDNYNNMSKQRKKKQQQKATARLSNVARN